MGQRIPKGASRSVGLKSPLTIFGKLLTPDATPLTQVDFSYGLPTGAFVSTFTSGSGSVVGGRGHAELRSGGTAAGDYALLSSARPARLRDGQTMEAMVMVQFDSPQANCIQLTNRLKDLKAFDLLLLPGQTLTISGRALSTTTSVITGTSWIEER